MAWILPPTAPWAAGGHGYAVNLFVIIVELLDNCVGKYLLDNNIEVYLNRYLLGNCLELFFMKYLRFKRNNMFVDNFLLKFIFEIFINQYVLFNEFGKTLMVVFIR